MLTRDLLLIEIAPTTEPPDPYHIMPPPMPPRLASGAPLPIGVTNAVPKGQTFTVQMAVANSLGAPVWSATGLPAGTSIDPATGLISGAGTAQGDSYATITADDTANGGTITTYPMLLSIGAAFSLVGSLKQATRGQPYQGNVIPVGATGTLTWSMTGNPIGLSISSTTGLITGTANVPGKSNITISAADSGTGTTASITVPFVVNRLINAIALDGSLTVVPKILAGSGFMTIATACNAVPTQSAGTQPITWTATNLPVGIDIDEQSGVVSGQTIADAAGTYAATLTATDVWGNTFSRVVSFVVVNGIKALAKGQFAVGDDTGQAVSLDSFAAYFGDGSDGDLVLDGTNTYPGLYTKVGFAYTQLRPIYANTITIGANVTINVAGLPTFVKVNTDRTAANTHIVCNGNAATGTTQGNGVNSAYFGANGNGGIGATGVVGAGVAGGAPNPSGTFPGQVGTAGAGGNGGAGAGGGGGPGAGPQLSAATVARTTFPLRMPLMPFAWGFGCISGGLAGGGGGSGAGNGTLVGGNGGGGGGPGGVIFWFTRTLTMSASSAASWGAVGGGGADGGAAGGSGRGAGGGGGGASGGVIWIVCVFYDGPTGQNTATVSGGDGGNKGTQGSGSAGADGVGASSGFAFFYELSTNTSASIGIVAPSGRLGGTAVLTF
jgi:hypothetical protein